MLGLRRDSGELTDVADVDRAVFEAFRVLRDRVLQAGKRAAPDVLGVADVGEVERLIEDHLRAALSPDPNEFAAAMPWRKGKP